MKHIYTHIDIYRYMYIHRHTHICFVYIYVDIHIYVHIYPYIHIYTHVDNMDTCTIVCLYIYTSIIHNAYDPHHAHLHIHTHTHTHTTWSMTLSQIIRIFVLRLRQQLRSCILTHMYCYRAYCYYYLAYMNVYTNIYCYYYRVDMYMLLRLSCMYTYAHSTWSMSLSQIIWSLLCCASSSAPSDADAA